MKAFAQACRSFGDGRSLGVTLVAAAIPARRAARVGAMEDIRGE